MNSLVKAMFLNLTYFASRSTRSLRYLPALFVIVFASGVLIGSIVQKYYRGSEEIRVIGPTNIPALMSSRVIVPPSVIAEPGIPEEFLGRLSLFILAGQSNMSGRGDLPPKQSIHPKIFVFGNDYRWKIAREPIDAAQGQVDLVSEDKEAAFGPGLAFATYLLEARPEMAVGLIPCAKASTSIVEWQRNLSETSLYGSCLKRIRAATTMGAVVAMLFFQGESDALDPDRFSTRSPSASSYAEAFATFVGDLRKDVSLPSMPVVFAQIGTHKAAADYVNWEIVKEQQRRIKLACAVMITTDDLAVADEVHFTTESYRLIGQRYADAFLQLTAVSNGCDHIR
jgi:hypothetical protein